MKLFVSPEAINITNDEFDYELLTDLFYYAFYLTRECKIPAETFPPLLNAVQHLPTYGEHVLSGGHLSMFKRMRSESTTTLNGVIALFQITESPAFEAIAREALDWFDKNETSLDALEEAPADLASLDLRFAEECNKKHAFTLAAQYVRNTQELVEYIEGDDEHYEQLRQYADELKHEYASALK
ncbi:hypothetical protein [Halocynthiibacter styelae]|uniref:DUF4375 domain-containing protein n=1 Tax=Halocynthiibacter styelae TaxID=2761955 RepID=A0A8J7IBM6_9RHOB|nr:hypothetical protein [Paenihalocynthiibacter styelae]MBI1492403.1 hypothetical protein [Paenihalocynthiibacter styelae]